MTPSGATSSIATTLAANIKAARAESGLSQSKFGRLIDIDTQVVSAWERGLYRPNDTNLLRLAEVTGHDVAWFYTEHGSGEPTTEVAA